MVSLEVHVRPRTAKLEIPWPMMKSVEEVVHASEGSFESVDEFVRAALRESLDKHTSKKGSSKKE